MREKRPMSGGGKRTCFYRDATSVSPDVRQRVTQAARTAAQVLGVTEPKIIFVEETSEAKASYKFDALIATHNVRKRNEFSRTDKLNEIYVNTDAPLPELLAGIDNHMATAAREDRTDKARDISGSRYKRR